MDEGATVGYESPQLMVLSGHHGGKRDIGKCPGRTGRALSKVSLGHASLDREHTSGTCDHPFKDRRRAEGTVVGGANWRTHVAKVWREIVVEDDRWWGKEALQTKLCLICDPKVIICVSQNVSKGQERGDQAV